MAQKPVSDRLEADLGSRANMLRVSIHTDLGQQLGARYHFEFTPLFVVLDSTGKEIWRGNRAPSIQTVLSPGA
jgi:hypothetical protein